MATVAATEDVFESSQILREGLKQRVLWWPLFLPMSSDNLEPSFNFIVFLHAEVFVVSFDATLTPPIGHCANCR